MRAIALLLGALVLLPFAAEGQDAGAGPTPRSATVRPADVVAERVRNILFGDPNRASLTELAEVIPETSIARSERVAAPESAAPVDVAEAVASMQVAEPIALMDAAEAISPTGIPESVSTVAIPEHSMATDEILDVVAQGPEWTSESFAPASAAPSLREASLIDRLRTVNVETLFRLLAGLLVLVVLVTLLRRRGAGLTLPAMRRTGRGPVVDARSLVARGVPLHEITRRTGLGRDALALLAHRKPS